MQEDYILVREDKESLKGLKGFGSFQGSSETQFPQRYKKSGNKLINLIEGVF